MSWWLERFFGVPRDGAIADGRRGVRLRRAGAQRWEVWNRETKIRHIHHGTREHVEAQLEKMAERWKRLGRGGLGNWKTQGMHISRTGRPKTEIGRAVDEVLAKPGNADKTAGELAPLVVALVPITVENAKNRIYAARRKSGQLAPARTTPEPEPVVESAGQATYEEEIMGTTAEVTKAAYKKLETSLGRPPIAGEVAKELGITEGAAHQRLTGLRQRGDLPRVPNRGGAFRKGVTPKSTALVTRREPAPPRPRGSRASSRTSAPAGLEGVVEDLRARRAEAAAVVERIDRAIAALGA